MAERLTTPEQAAEIAAAAMRAMGHPDAQQAHDGGPVDVRAARATAMVAFRPTLVERSELQRLVGARGYETYLQLFCFAVAGYTDKALEYAQHMDIAAFTFDEVGRVTAVSPAARRARAMPGPTTKRSVAKPPASPRSPWWKRRRDAG